MPKFCALSGICGRQAFLSHDGRRDWPRLRVAEALVLLAVARLLVRGVPLKHWRGSLGRMAAPAGPLAFDDAMRLRCKRLSRAVQRAADRLPGTSKCLPQAMALQWMLARRAIASTLVFGIRPPALRDQGDALHAWVEVGGVVVLGGLPDMTFQRGLELTQP